MNSAMPRILVLAGLTLAGVVGPAAGPATAGTAATGLSITARHARLGTDLHTVVLVGTYTCGPFPAGVPDRGVIDLGVRQIVDGVEVVGIGYLEPTVCTGRPQRYATELVAYSGSFIGGRATWSASGYVEGSDGMQNVHVPLTPIRVRASKRHRSSSVGRDGYGVRRQARGNHTRIGPTPRFAQAKYGTAVTSTGSAGAADTGSAAPR